MRHIVELIKQLQTLTRHICVPILAHCPEEVAFEGQKNFDPFIAHPLRAKKKRQHSRCLSALSNSTTRKPLSGLRLWLVDFATLGEQKPKVRCVLTHEGCALGVGKFAPITLECFVPSHLG